MKEINFNAVKLVTRSDVAVAQTELDVAERVSRRWILRPQSDRAFDAMQLSEGMSKAAWKARGDG